MVQVHPPVMSVFESLNQIEGIVTTKARLKQLVEDKTTIKNRDEEEILGYRNALNIIADTKETYCEVI